MALFIPAPHRSPEMPRSRPFTHSVVLGFVGQAVTMLAGLSLSPFLIHHLGRREYGLWIVGQQLLVYLTVADLGVIALLPRETAYVTGRDDASLELPRLLARTLRLLVFQTPVVWAVTLAAWFAVPESWGQTRQAIGLAAAAFCALFPFRFSRAVLEGLQDLAFISWSYMSSWLIGLIVSVVLVMEGNGLRALAIGWAASQLVDATACTVRLRWRHPHAVPSSLRTIHNQGTRDQFVRGLWMSVSQTAQVLIYGTDAAVVVRLFGAGAVVPYNCTGKLISVLSNQPQLIMRAAEPGLSAMRASEPRERLAAVTDALRLAMLLLSGLVTTVTLAVNPEFVRWWMGSQYFGGMLLCVLFAVSMLMRHLNITAIYTLFAFRHERRLAITSLADGVLSTIFSIILAWWLHSPVGVVLGSILSTLLVLGFGNAPKLARELGVSLLDLAKPLAGWFWRMVLAGWLACLAGSWMPQSGPMGIALLALAAAVGYAALMYPVAMRSSLRPYLAPYTVRLRILALAEEH